MWRNRYRLIVGKLRVAKIWGKDMGQRYGAKIWGKDMGYRLGDFLFSPYPFCFIPPLSAVITLPHQHHEVMRIGGKGEGRGCLYHPAGRG